MRLEVQEGKTYRSRDGEKHLVTLNEDLEYSNAAGTITWHATGEVIRGHISGSDLISEVTAEEKELTIRRNEYGGEVVDLDEALNEITSDFCNYPGSGQLEMLTSDLEELKRLNERLITLLVRKLQMNAEELSELLGPKFEVT